MTRGDIYMLDFGVPFGSELGYRRPVIIIQSSKENRLSYKDAIMTKSCVIPNLFRNLTLRAEKYLEVFKIKSAILSGC